MSGQRTYYCIDMKSFYASVECAERGYNPFETNLVVADCTRGKNALCLAITPHMKSLGIKNRCRLSEIPAGVKYEVAPPRMALYVEYAADIYSLYLDYFAPQDMHVYSIDESFIDATDYLEMYRRDKIDFAGFLMNEIASRYRIPSTAGIGTNLYLAKIALDITAKHSKNHIGFLDEDIYRATLWKHRPITDFWMVAGGTAARLARYGVYDMQGVTEMPTELMYKIFGRNAELLIDHAWGRESCLMEDIKNYRSKTHSVSFSQILPRDYTAEEARTVIQEMARNGAEELTRRKVITGKVSIFVGYTRDMRAPTGGSARLGITTCIASYLAAAAVSIYDATTDRSMLVRRLGISFDNVCDEGCEGYDLFTDFEAVERARNIQRAVVDVKSRFGKNAVLSGINLMPEGTQRERNGFIGGHRAGYDDKSGKS
ncbi:MAG: DNA repair protein [Clostridia bacterium]|nr:DNA repair protein [Clostridia bacterium]